MTKPNDCPEIKDKLFVIAMWNGEPFPDTSRLIMYMTAKKDAQSGIALWGMWKDALTYKSAGEAQKAMDAEVKFRKSKKIDKDFPGSVMSIKELKKKVKWRDVA